MAAENSPKGKKAFYSSGLEIGYAVGLVLATGSVSLVLMTFGEQAFADWAWRIPSIASAILLFCYLPPFGFVVIKMSNKNF